MKAFYRGAVVFALLAVLTIPNSSQAQAAQQQSQPTQSVPSPTRGPVLEDGTPVKLRINRTVSSGDAHVGETVDFEVLEEVRVANTVVIPKGGIALGTVTEAQPKRRMGRGGKLNINIDHVRLVDGEKVALRAVKEVQGGGHTGAMTGGIVATSLIFFPAAPFFLFMHGKDITIPKGTEVAAYINGSQPLDLAKFGTGSGQPSTVPATDIPPAPSVPGPEMTFRRDHGIARDHSHHLYTRWRGDHRQRQIRRNHTDYAQPARRGPSDRHRQEHVQTLAADDLHYARRHGEYQGRPGESRLTR